MKELAPCRSCNRHVDMKATTCPFCTADDPSPSRTSTNARLVGRLLVAAGVGGTLWTPLACSVYGCPPGHACDDQNGPTCGDSGPCTRGVCEDDEGIGGGNALRCHSQCKSDSDCTLFAADALCRSNKRGTGTYCYPADHCNCSGCATTCAAGFECRALPGGWPGDERCLRK